MLLALPLIIEDQGKDPNDVEEEISDAHKMEPNHFKEKIVYCESRGFYSVGNLLKSFNIETLSIFDFESVVELLFWLFLLISTISSFQPLIYETPYLAHQI